MKVIKTITIILLALMLVVFFSNVYAQDKTTFNLGFKPKSETNALLWSLSGTIVPIYTGTKLTENGGPVRLLLIASGVFVGPSLGYFYGDIPKRGLRGFAIRGGVMLGSLVVGSSMGLDICWCPFGNCNSDCDDDGWAVVGLGTLFVMGHALYDIIAVPFAVREHNISLQSTSLKLIPKYFADSGAGGLELQVTF